MSVSLRLLLLVCVSSSLAACGEPNELWTESDIRDLARQESSYIAATVDNNADASTDLAERVDALESELSSLELENDLLRSEVESLRAELSYLN